jgi:DNA-directed RNA polymerase specialized sigma24 family protein
MGNLCLAIADGPARNAQRRRTMALPLSDSDRQLARQVARREPDAISAFRATFDPLLDRAFSDMQEHLAQAQPPGCRKPFDDLVPHVAGASGESFIKQIAVRKGVPHAAPNKPRKSARGKRKPNTLDEHVTALALPDLFLASACLLRDNAACLQLVEIVDKQVGRRLVKQFRSRLSEGRAQEVVDNVLSQAWSVSNSHLGTPPFEDTPEDGAVPKTRLRLEKYLGLSTLKTWLFSMAYHMLIEETRRKEILPPPPGPDEPDGYGGPVKTDPEPLPPDDAALRELVVRFKPRIQSELNRAFADLGNRKSDRHAQVAFLWLSCRSQQVFIARVYDVTKARVSQQASEITDYLVAATNQACRDLSVQSGVPLEQIVSALRGHLPEFFEPVLFNRLLDAFRRLQTERPRLFHLAFLAWRQQRTIPEISEQLEESSIRIARLLDQLTAWRAEVASRIAAELSRSSGVAVEPLRERVDQSIDELFGGRDVSPDLSVIRASDSRFLP